MVHFNVNFARFNSFTDITMVLSKTLHQMGIPVSVEPSEIVPGTPYVLEDEDQELLKQFMSNSPSDLFQIRWSHYWHSCLLRKLTGHVNLEVFAINYQFTKTDEPFDDWIEDVIKNPYHTLAISEYCQQVLLGAGCSPDKVSVIPLGFNRELITVDPAPKLSQQLNNDRKYILHLTNSWDFYRFGTDILIPAFCQEFQDRTDVELFIKDAGANPEIIGEYIRKSQKQNGGKIPPIRATDRFLTKKQLARLYLSVDALVAPFRGEGFAIKVLDGFAAGLPVAMTLYGGPTEYGTPANCYPIDYDLVPVGECYDTKYYQIYNSPHWAEPRLSSLREQLRNLVDDPHRHQVAANAQATAQNFSWEMTSRKLLKLMRQLS